MLSYLCFGWILSLFVFRFPYLFPVPVLFMIGCLVKKKTRSVLCFVIGAFMGGCCSIDLLPYPTEQRHFEGTVYERKENYFLFLCEGRRYYVSDPDHPYEIADRLAIEGDVKDISFRTLEGTFDFKAYLYEKKVEKCIRIQTVKIVFHTPIRPASWADRYLEGLNDSARILTGMMLFHRASAESESLYALRIAHLFSLSGMQIYFLFSMVERIIRHFTNDKKISRWSGVALLFPLFILSEFRLSFFRCLIHLILKNLEIDGEKRRSVDWGILLSILAINSRYVFTTSFLYLFMFPFLMRKAETAIRSYREGKRKIIRAIYLFLISGWIGIYTDGTLNLSAFFLLPLTIGISHIYFLASLLYLLIPHPRILNDFGELLLRGIRLCGEIPLVLYFDAGKVLILAIGFVLFFCALYFAEMRIFTLSHLPLGAFLLACLIAGSPLDALTTQYVCFINVGQGDCALVHNRGRNVLIDTGGALERDIAREVLIPFFQRRHIRKIDTVFISHEDYDHSGALISLKSHFPVGEVVSGSDFYEKEAGGIRFRNLNRYAPGKEENENSSVLFFHFLDLRFLLTGDAPQEIERKIIRDHPELETDILKIGHHGSSTSSCLAFLRTVHPEEAVISVGEGNRYGHPSSIVLTFLRSLNITIRRTDLEGSVQYTKDSLKKGRHLFYNKTVWYISFTDISCPSSKKRSRI